MLVFRSVLGSFVPPQFSDLSLSYLFLLLLLTFYSLFQSFLRISLDLRQSLMGFDEIERIATLLGQNLCIVRVVYRVDVQLL
jgi:hypothetical protein